VAAEINDVTREGEKCSLAEACLELIDAGSDIDYDGGAGPLDFVDAGEPGAGAYDTWRFDAEAAVEVIEESIAVTAEE
jgi:branched-chain amino acid transport system substrate-binding protein